MQIFGPATTAYGRMSDGDQMPPASGALQHWMQRRSGLCIEARELVAKLLQAFYLILERRQRIGQAPNIDFQPVNTL